MARRSENDARAHAHTLSFVRSLARYAQGTPLGPQRRTHERQQNSARVLRWETMMLTLSLFRILLVARSN